MTRILLVWEDRYYDTLGPFVKRRLAGRAPAGHRGFPQVLFHTAHGAGGFKRYVASTWDNARAKGLPLDKGTIDHLVCVVDGDKLHEQLATVAPPPARAAGVPAWLATAEQAWQQHLRGLCDNAPRTTVHGRILRWSKESVVLAGYDREAVKQHLGIDIQTAALEKHLARCVPAPASIKNDEFSNTFPKPLRCLKELDEAQRAPRASGLVKNAPELDDALRALVRDDHAVIAERVPDIDRLADLIWQLAMPAPPPAAPPPAAAAAVGSPPKKRPRSAPKRSR
jgi:hypothetical protein